MTRTAAFLALSLTLATSTLSVAGDQPHKGDGHKRFWDELGLSAKQKSELLEIRKKHHESMKGTHVKMREVRESVRAELARDTPDRKVLDAASDKAGAIARDLNTARFEYMLEIKGILDSKQFETLLNREWRGGHGRDKADPHPCKGSCAKDSCAHGRDGQCPGHKKTGK